MNIGDKGTGLAFHNHGAAWVIALRGRKHRMVFDPKYFRRMEVCDLDFILNIMDFILKVSD